jgi:hypothetical protein
LYHAVKLSTFPGWRQQVVDLWRGEKMSGFFQSGQKVTIAGVYEVVGARTGTDKLATREREMAIREFKVGDMLPDFEGRAVTWYLRQETQPPAAADAKK